MLYETQSLIVKEINYVVQPGQGSIEKSHKLKKMNDWIDPRCSDLHVRI
ncbi:unnamed protein product [Camellia sinensis]